MLWSCRNTWKEEKIRNETDTQSKIDTVKQKKNGILISSKKDWLKELNKIEKKRLENGPRSFIMFESDQKSELIEGK